MKAGDLTSSDLILKFLVEIKLTSIVDLCDSVTLVKVTTSFPLYFFVTPETLMVLLAEKLTF